MELLYIARTVGEFFVDPIFAVPMGTENDAAANRPTRLADCFPAMRRMSGMMFCHPAFDDPEIVLIGADVWNPEKYQYLYL